jgi:hypothetical protein
VLVAPEQTASASIEAEAFEQKNIPDAERLHTGLPPGVKILGNFSRI